MMERLQKFYICHWNVRKIRFCVAFLCVHTNSVLFCLLEMGVLSTLHPICCGWSFYSFNRKIVLVKLSQKHSLSVQCISYHPLVFKILWSSRHNIHPITEYSTSIQLLNIQHFPWCTKYNKTNSTQWVSNGTWWPQGCWSAAWHCGIGK